MLGDITYVHFSGSIMYGDVQTVSPFANSLDLVQINGTTLKQMFEFSVKDYNANAIKPPGGFLQVSGLFVCFYYL